MTEKQLLENILTADILILARLTNAEKKAKGVTKLGGDYTREALREIRESKEDLIARLKLESRTGE